MKSNIEKWVWIAENDTALEFVYFLESLGSKFSFKEIYKYCNLQEKLKNRNIIKTVENCETLAVDYRYKNDECEDDSLFADAILVLSLIIIDCHNNNGSSDLTSFVGAEKNVKLKYDKENVDLLIDSLELIKTYLPKFFGLGMDEESVEDEKDTITEIKQELQKVSDDLQNESKKSFWKF